MEIIIKGREYRRDNIRVSLNLMENFNNGELTYKVVEEFWDSKGHVNKLLRGIYRNKLVAKVEYRRMLNNLERTLPLHEVEMAMY